MSSTANFNSEIFTKHKKIIFPSIYDCVLCVFIAGLAASPSTFCPAFKGPVISVTHCIIGQGVQQYQPKNDSVCSLHVGVFILSFFSLNTWHPHNTVYNRYTGLIQQQISETACITCIHSGPK